MSEVSDFLKALGLFIGGAFLFILAVVLIPAKCESQIDEGERAIGAKVYLNGQFLGLMEERQWRWDDKVFRDSRFCTRRRLRKGDLLRVEKEGFQTYTATIDPNIDESGPPYYRVYIKLVPLSDGEGSKAP